MDHGCGTADSLLYGDSFGRAIARTCAALHAGVQIVNPYFLSVPHEDSVRANSKAHTATRAACDIVFQRSYIFQIFHRITPPKKRTRSPMTRRSIPPAVVKSISGIAVFISLSTPDREVYVELPVKFIVK